MSSDIIYHQVAVRIPVAHTGLQEDLFVHLQQVGSSNCYEVGRNGRNGRRAREWTAVSFGTAKQVLTEGIQTAGHTEGGMLKMGSATDYTTPERYIRKVRSLLSEAQATDIRKGLRYQGQPVSLSIAYREPEVDGRRRKTHYELNHPPGFAAFWDRYLAENGHTKRAWNFFEVYGPEMR